MNGLNGDGDWHCLIVLTVVSGSAAGGQERAPYCGVVRTLHPAYRVTDLVASLHFYTTLGYGQVGRVDLGNGASLTMLKFSDDEVVTLELVHRPAAGPVEVGSGFSHIAVQVDNLSETVDSLARAGLTPGELQRPGGPDGAQTSWLTDPDGYRIELVQWPRGHAYGLTAADFGSPAER